MATTTLNRPPESALTAGVVFHGVNWSDYEAMLRIVGERPIRVTYDRGTMEVFMPSFGHEGDAHLLGKFVETLAEELDIPLKSGRTTTHKREDLDRGAEPDQCYWIGENADKLIGKRQLDLTVDPPPDLVIEVDVTSSSLPRLPIFGAMGVSEVWRLDRQTLQFLELQPDGTYQPREQSRFFPNLNVADVARFLDLSRSTNDTGWVRSLRAYVRDHLLPRPPEGLQGPEQP